MIGNIFKLFFYLALIALLVVVAAGMALASLVSSALDGFDGVATAPSPATVREATAVEAQAPSDSLGEAGPEVPVLLEAPQADAAPATVSAVAALVDSEEAAATVIQLADDAFVVEDAFGDMPVPPLDESEAAPSGSHTATIPVYVCAPADRHGDDYLAEQVAVLQTHVATFFARESSGALNLEFVAAEIISPAGIDWSTTSMREQHNELRRTKTPYHNPCVSEARDLNAAGTDNILVLADMPAGTDPANGYGYFGGPAIALTRNNHRGADLERFLRTVAHELGHSVLRLCHPHQTSRPVNDPDNAGECGITETVHGHHYDKAAFQQYHDDHVYDPADESLMSYKRPDAPGKPGVYEFEHSYINCRQRYIKGFDIDGCRGAPITDPGYLAEPEPEPMPEPVPEPEPMPEPVPEPVPVAREVRIAWGSDATGRGDDCPPSANCRNLTYHFNGDFGTTPYYLECLGEGHDPWRGDWYGNPESGCYYRDSGHTIYVVVDGVRSNDLVGPPAPEPEPRVVQIAWGSDATGRGDDCPPSANCRNLTYHFNGDFGTTPYYLECLGEGHDPWRGDWYGNPESGCYYRDSGHTIYVVVDGVRSNDLRK